MECPSSEKRTSQRHHIPVTQVKMGDKWNYFYGYAKNISCSGALVYTVASKNVGEEFEVELTLPTTDITVRCRSKVVWRRDSPLTGKYGQCMGLKFYNLEPIIVNSIDKWIEMQTRSQA